MQAFWDFKAEFYIHLDEEYGTLPLRLEKFENKIFKLLIGGSTARLACSMQGVKMKLIISFSGRADGNCDRIASYISSADDTIVYFRELNVQPCSCREYA